jgi:uncharacterized protein YidB (DUF937 family)
MGIFDSILNQVTNAVGGASGEQSGFAASVLNMINRQPGGLAGLVQTFKDKGLGPMVSSWISTGPNPPISTEQVQHVMGNEELQKLAAEHNIDVDQVSAQLAQILPVLVDKMTPDGQLPQAGGLMSEFKNILGQGNS